MEGAHLQQLICFLTHIEDATCDSAEFAKERGISRKDNAITGFKSMIKKYGLVYDGKKFTAIGGSDGDQPVPATPASTKKSTPRKRKAQANGDTVSGDEAASPKKKATKKTPKKEVKVEVEMTDAKPEDDNED